MSSQSFEAYWAETQNVQRELDRIKRVEDKLGRRELPKPKGLLYAIAWERYGDQGLTPVAKGIDYVHSERGASDALFTFINALDSHEQYCTKVVCCGLAIGFKVLDKEGLLLSA